MRLQLKNNDVPVWILLIKLCFSLTNWYCIMFHQLQHIFRNLQFQLKRKSIV